MWKFAACRNARIRGALPGWGEGEFGLSRGEGKQGYTVKGRSPDAEARDRVSSRSRDGGSSLSSDRGTLLGRAKKSGIIETRQESRQYCPPCGGIREAPTDDSGSRVSRIGVELRKERRIAFLRFPSDLKHSW
ncbi:hypothetical protein KM043_002394 [Ampulex compressa]|nr:hypothetical protein KM043_002394 [Ampulex compressa]